MVRSRTPSQGGGSQGFEMERKYSVPSNPDMRPFSGTASEDLHAWSIYRQNLNSDFTDSALGSTDKSPLPYGNFQLRDTTVQSILSHPRYGPKSTLGSNMYTYLKFGLPRVFPPNHNGSTRSGRNTPQHFTRNASTRPKMRSQKMSSRGPREGSSGYDSSDNETNNQYKHNRKYRSDPDFRMQNAHPSYHQQINLLIEELGLEQVRNTKVSSMTISERRRLNVACHLLQDTDIVVLDQPTRGMDIFDTFFLIEYLRQWANGGAGGSSLGRIVILTLHPPTYEIFMMLSRILLLSAGRVMFSGRRRDMLPYFALVDYPCPNFKNPSDYYLDLVTLDDLSAEAMLESSQRIEQLGEVFRQKQPPLSDPGPPSALPMPVRRSNCLVQSLALFTKAMVYTQPGTFIKWLTLVMMSASLSLILGAIFWDVPNTDPQLILNDRLGYHYAVMCVAPWPLLLYLTLSEVKNNRKTVERDIRDGLYGRLTYILTKTAINLFPSLFIWLIYVIPSYSMCGLYMQHLNNYDGFYVYIGVMLMLLSCLQAAQLALVYLLPFSNTASTLASLISTVLFLAGGYVLHYRDMPFYVGWLRRLSPMSWLMPYVLNRELSAEAIESSAVAPLCRNKQVQHQDIIVQLPCPSPNGTQVLFNYGYLPSQNQVFDYGSAPLALLVFYLICIVIACLGFLCNCGRSRQKRANYGDSNKP
ncbi:hypothetical protein HUJ04_006237 [Dendroctonus ponderosae]|nr:hypothetical protein HUJ04_006237 [Dendroctonus ponderosae]